MKKTKCALCDAEVASPRGQKALDAGWSTIDATLGKGNNAEHLVVSVCPDHQGHAFEEFKKLEQKWLAKRKQNEERLR